MAAIGGMLEMQRNTMRGCAIIFDTNAYRNLVYSCRPEELIPRIDELALQELRQGVQPFASPWVLIELFARLAEPTSAAYNNCRDAVRSIWRHCAVQHPEQDIPVLAIAAGSEEQLCKTLFGVDLADHRAASSLLATGCKQVYEAGESGSLDELQPVFEDMKRHVAAVERDFVSDLFKYAVKGFNADAVDWNPLAKKPELRAAVLEFSKSPEALERVAEAIVLKAAMLSHSQLNRKLGRERLEDMKDAVQEHFSVSLQHYNDILHRIARTGSDYTKKNRANDIWDHQLTFLIGRNHSIAGKQVKLISDDGGISEAARKAGVPELVCSLEDYLAALM
jgi:hypothetical protein